MIKISLLAMVLGYVLDLWIGDPYAIPHPVQWIGKWILFLESYLRKIFPKTKRGEEVVGIFLWMGVIFPSFLIPYGTLKIAYGISPYVALFIESIFCWQILATKSLGVESKKVYLALKKEGIEEGRRAVSMIVGRDTESLNEKGVVKATVETIAENTSDGVVAPLFFLFLGGAPLGFFYKAANTLDSMVGYVEMPYKNIGWFSAKADDVLNFIPARLGALCMLLAGTMLGMDGKNGWRIFKRDRFSHASPNSAQTESVCAGLLRVELAGDAWYHGELHRKKFIGDPIRPIVLEDILQAIRLLYGTSIVSFLIFVGLGWIFG
ncbi:adenosylcobinamide-phosphate synthase CbiB [Peptoniphilus sp. KCTC 25270]|uniref:adenosylcobinamide-phosphate synthase CbiB n=1 Tax=Peptoniphilus sp. KCTC 25270 TaxID=2897414 RepID=UPI001E2EB808|nr:adenosylcobinamide-phosphate synthase CbiB [Peptoniphilus sp. KCTC 25270]MCD1147450.1 adenosylcobinamide-phosphate synthase CbiB [Peptoniphilus sp. KCTC 25270]